MANEDALKFNAVQNAVEKYDADGDGKLDGECGISDSTVCTAFNRVASYTDLETVCKKYDTDGNGTFLSLLSAYSTSSAHYLFSCDHQVLSVCLKCRQL